MFNRNLCFFQKPKKLDDLKERGPIQRDSRKEKIPKKLDDLKKGRPIQTNSQSKENFTRTSTKTTTTKKPLSRTRTTTTKKPITTTRRTEIKTLQKRTTLRPKRFTTTTLRPKHFKTTTLNPKLTTTTLRPTTTLRFTTLRTIFTLPRYPTINKADVSETTISTVLTTLRVTTASTTERLSSTTTTSHLLSRTTPNQPQQVPVQKEIKIYRLFKPVKDLSKRMTSTDCGDKICSLRHQFLKDCYLLIHTNKTDCNIPCHLEGCKKELHHFMNCPIWECNSSTTTTTSTSTESTATTTYTTTTSGPTPMPIPISTTSILLYISIGINLVFVLIGLIMFAYRKYCQRAPYQPIQEELPLRRRVSLLSNDNRFFSVGSESESETNDQRVDTGSGLASNTGAGSGLTSNTGAIPKRSTQFETVNLQSPDDATPSTSLQSHGNSPLPRYSNYSTFKPATNPKNDNERETTF